MCGGKYMALWYSGLEHPVEGSTHGGCNK
uniref:Uncharacterized protein n=2 Tax=Moniliophthora roreri TaxID=221103 RepID=A0A0W0FTD0_MONRR